MGDTATLSLRLAGPMQSWGTGSRFVRRTTNTEPSKSGVIGLLAAAQGRRRTEPLEDLLSLRFGVRIDQPGQLLRDFQTESREERTRDGWRTVAMPLSYRYYLADAAFLAVVEGDRELIGALDQALQNPIYPLSLGRRSCPPAGKVSLGVRDETLETTLRHTPWIAAEWYQTRHSSTSSLWVVRDAGRDEAGNDREQDAPRSFDPRHRAHGVRAVVRERVLRPDYEAPLVSAAAGDPFDELEA